MKKTLASLSLLASVVLASFPALAATGSFTKTSTAPSITVYSDGSASTALTSFMVSSTDFPSGTLNKPKTLTQVRYSLASYPGASSEYVQLCYYRPYTASAAKCIDVNPGTTSNTSDFNSYTFDNGVQLQVRRDVTGAPGSQLRPSRQESVTLEFNY
ncbi:hypothetical protein K5J60_004198 [Salmonella enterica]|nr:hypothetical protein [Salmonella enterica]ECC3884263.1 hypothetical protein [Salmonella enterica subsp. diarizonae]EFO9811931.1 hypothetical protein [Salmonella enterica subsp. enterica serovar Enteritidis]EIE2749660.1 hypothetical protein [Salmonella enterica subsp. diarizonae serovar 48:i:z]ECJ4781286.1 hypothetical protein [Salmonella enterica subsp. diarizonae]